MFAYEKTVLYNPGMNNIENKRITVIGKPGRGWATDPFIMAINKGIRIRESHTLPKGTLGVLNRYNPHASDVAIINADSPEYTQRLTIAHILDKYEELSSENRPDEEFRVTIEEADLQQH